MENDIYFHGNKLLLRWNFFTSMEENFMQVVFASMEVAFASMEVNSSFHGSKTYFHGSTWKLPLLVKEETPTNFHKLSLPQRRSVEASINFHKSLPTAITCTSFYRLK